MKREYSSGQNESVRFFIGKEIERTPAYGMKTLFVVGLQNADEIRKNLIDPYTQISEPVTHLYFGANQSFKPASNKEWQHWDVLLCEFLEEGYWVTLDFDVSQLTDVHESAVNEYRRFIPQISVKIPYLHLLNYNATLKIDDTGFEDTNPGVWCHRLQTLTSPEVFTGWDEYTKDEIIE